MPLREARISPLDRSFLFGDGVYEVIPARHGQARRLAANLARLSHSLRELRIRDPLSEQQWSGIVQQLIDANGGGDVYVYLQVSRGAEYGRNHAPLPDIEPTVFGFCVPLPLPTSEVLLANVLLRQQAVEAGAGEIILLRDGNLTEASASSVEVIIDGEIRMPQNSARLLPGTTRSLVEELADRHGIARRVAAVSESQLRAADEIWLTAATRGVIAVTTLDGRPVGNGKPGPLWRRMHQLIESYWID